MEEAQTHEEKPSFETVWALLQEVGQLPYPKASIPSGNGKTAAIGGSEIP